MICTWQMINDVPHHYLIILFVSHHQQKNHSIAAKFHQNVPFYFTLCHSTSWHTLTKHH